MFNAISTAGTGLNTYQTWLDAIANNIANVNDVSPTSGKAFQAQYIQASAIGGGAYGAGQGVAVTGITGSSAQGQLVQDPNNPIADAQGYVRHPDIDMGQQMGDLIMAQRAFQANATLVDRAKDVYEAAIAIGKGL
jgi:flagellar basal-body rod protein FlgC